MIHKDCFAHRIWKGKDHCTALETIDCDNCAFYKSKMQAQRERMQSIRTRQAKGMELTEFDMRLLEQEKKRGG